MGDPVDIAATTPLTADFRDDRSIEGDDTASSLLKLVLTVPKLLSVLLVSARDVAAPLVFDDPKLPRLVGTTGGLGVMNARGEGAHLNAVTPRTRASSRRIRVAPADSPECPEMMDSTDHRSGEFCPTVGRGGGRDRLRLDTAGPVSITTPRSSSCVDMVSRSFDNVD